MAKRKLTDSDIERMETNARKRTAWGGYVAWQRGQNLIKEFRRTYPGADLESDEFEQFARQKRGRLYIG
jgi:hypothetical protein